MSETDLVQALLVELSGRDALVYRNNTGMLYETIPTGQFIGGRPTYFRGRPVHFGLEGSPDIEGFCRRTGLWIGIEAKARRGVMRAAQLAFAAQAQASPVIYGVARSVSDAVRILTQRRPGG